MGEEWKRGGPRFGWHSSIIMASDNQNYVNSNHNRKVFQISLSYVIHFVELVGRVVTTYTINQDIQPK
jgi:hypothetical protein